MKIARMFYFNLFGKKLQKVLGSKKCMQNLRHQAVEAEALRVKAEAIEKFPLLRPWHYDWFLPKQNLKSLKNFNHSR